MAQHFFDQLRLIREFFRRHKVRKLYEGTAVVRLLDTRWTGHINACTNVLKNFPQIIETLDKIKQRNHEIKFDGDDIALADGIHRAISKSEFVFMLIFVTELLGLIEPADKILQNRQMGYREAQPVIQATIGKIRELRSKGKFEEIKIKMIAMIDENPTAQPAEKRNRRRSSRLNDSIVYETLGERGDCEVEIRAAFFDVIDSTVNELERRFNNNNEILLAISDSPEMDIHKLQPLTEVNIKLPSKEELSIAKAFIDNERQRQEQEKANATEEKILPLNIPETLYK